jgi:hypothetical protein
MGRRRAGGEFGEACASGARLARIEPSRRGSRDTWRRTGVGLGVVLVDSANHLALAAGEATFC